MRETWRAIPGFVGHYEASSLGRIRSFKHGRRVRRTTKTPRGYTTVSLCLGGKPKTYNVHSLVALAFFGEPRRGQEVRHLNGVRSDNRAQNLRWGTREENQQDSIRHGTKPRGESHPRARLGRREVREIIKRYNRGGVTQKQLGQEYGIHHAHVHSIVRGKAWAWLTEATKES